MGPIAVMDLWGRVLLKWKLCIMAVSVRPVLIPHLIVFAVNLARYLELWILILFCFVFGLGKVSMDANVEMDV